MELTVDTDAGKLAGREKDGVLLFAGIPYAAPPTGERRFRPPAPVEPWEGTRDATRFGAAAPQPAGTGMLSAGPLEWDEDCLFLNVQTPGLDDAGRPVMVWIHGGAFLNGTGAIPWYDGQRLATHGDVVVVTINYRLGAFGWLELGGLDPDHRGSGNNGLLDQIAALDWVRRNIGAFGGDPGNVTIFGESAGAMSVATLLGTPAAAGLFRRAIAQSGAAHNVLDVDTADERARTFADHAGATTVADLVALDADAILDTQVATAARSLSLGGGGGLPFGPVVDGTVLPVPPVDAVRNGSAADVALLLGTNRDEWNIFGIMVPGEVDAATILRRLGRIADDPAALLEVYTRDGRSDADAWSAIMTDAVFRIPAIRLAEAQVAHQPATYLYQFDWPTPVFGGALGATHAVEIPFVFDTLHRKGVSAVLGDDPPASLAAAMHRAWLAFVHHDDPNHDGIPTWPAYDLADRPTLHFDVDCHLEHDPGAAQREAWATLR